MHGLGPCFMTGGNNSIRTEITFNRRSSSDMNSLIGHLDMKSIPISIGVHCNGGYAHGPGGADNPAGDFSTIGNQYFFKHESAF